VSGERGPNDPVVISEDVSVGILAQTPEQGCRTLDVGEEEGERIRAQKRKRSRRLRRNNPNLYLYRASERSHRCETDTRIVVVIG
jgi:hypothetical protein